MKDKSIREIGDVINNVEVYSKSPFTVNAAPLVEKKKLNKNQRCRENAADRKLNENTVNSEDKTTQIDRDPTMEKVDAKKVIPPINNNPDLKYSAKMTEKFESLKDFRGINQYYVTTEGRLKFWKENKYGLPEGCPVTPLGRCGDLFYFLDATKYIQSFTAAKLGNAAIKSIFSPHIKWMETHWPVIEVTKETRESPLEHKKFRQTSWKSGETQTALMDACSNLDYIGIASQVRGRGAWQNEDGNILYHCGNKLWTAHGPVELGIHGNHIYARDAKISSPWDNEVTDTDSPALVLFDMFKTWNWERPEIDPILLLGWIGCSVLSGALEWRPMVFVTGDRASGKSTIQKIIKNLFGDGLLETADTTPAGIYQKVQQSCLPIAIDELENDSENTRQKGIIRLARLASSGAKMHRGGADHQHTEFTLRSCFLMSAILMPPMESQDLSRMAVLELGALEQGQAMPKIDKKLMADYGRMIKRRMIDQWPQFLKVLKFYHTEMTSRGHEIRAADQFGTLLAAAHVMQNDNMPNPANVEKLLDLMAPNNMLEITDNASNADNCLQYLLESEIANWRDGNKQQVSTSLHEFIRGAPNDPDTISPPKLTTQIKYDLASVGMAINKRKNSAGEIALYLAVGIRHKQTITIFENSPWKSQANSKGVWAQALGRIPNSVRNHVVDISNKPTRCVCVPLVQIFKDDPAALKALNER